MLLFVPLLLACRTADCGALPGEERAACVQTSCDKHQLLERDGCITGYIKAATTPAEVLVLAPTVADPIMRDAAVIRWTDAHRRSLSSTDGKTLCGLLTRREGETCLRKLSAAHLSPSP